MSVVVRLAVALLWAGEMAIAAGVPATITVQGKMTDLDGVALDDGNYSLAFGIYDDPAAGNLLWSETLPVQVTGGLYVVLIGITTPFPANLFSGGSDRYLDVSVDGGPVSTPRVRLASVPYAYQSGHADVAIVAQDLVCNSCVTATDIATGAVGSSEIATDAVHSAEIASGAVGMDELAANSVGTLQVVDSGLYSGDLSDEPGVASNGLNSTLELDATTKTLLSRTINCPGSGYVLAIGTVQVQLEHAENFDTRCGFGVSSIAGDLPSNQSVAVELAGSAHSGIYRQAVTVHGLFSTNGGQDVFFLSGYELAGSVSVNDRQLSLIYFPTAYGTVADPVATGAGE